MSRWLFFCLALLVVAHDGPPCASADDGGPEDAIYGSGWGMTLALDGSGFYNDVLSHVLGKAGVEKPYLPLPYKRAKTEFAKDHQSCLYPARIEHLLRGNEIDRAEDYTETPPLVFVESHLFSQPGEPPLMSFAELDGRMVAYPNGSALPNVMADYGAIFVPTTDETTKARMLIAGRVDYMSGSLPDNIFVFQSLGEPLPPYNAELALIRTGVGVVCHRTEANEALVAAVTAALASAEGRAALASLYESLGVAARFLPAAQAASQ